MNSQKWSICFLIGSLFLMILIGLFTAIIDPFFHYHGPLADLEYPLATDKQRYQNDGIIKHFDYDAVITGSSMTENFMASECNELFSVNAIKVPFSGSYYKEINDNVQIAIDTHPNLRMVFRALDGTRLETEKDFMRTDAEYPTYLYDTNWLNDVYYLLNKDILFNHTIDVLEHTRSGLSTTTFDEYSNWNHRYTFGKNAIIKSYNRPDKKNVAVEFTDDARTMVRENLIQNAINIAKENPDITFYYFFPPYSIYYWDSLNQMGMLEYQIQEYRYATELLLQVDNIQLFSYFDDYEMIIDPMNYKDYVHYSEDINSRILHWMKDGEHKLTKDNYGAHWDNVLDYCQAYDYESLFS